MSPTDDQEGQAGPSNSNRLSTSSNPEELASAPSQVKNGCAASLERPLTNSSNSSSAPVREAVQRRPTLSAPSSAPITTSNPLPPTTTNNSSSSQPRSPQAALEAPHQRKVRVARKSTGGQQPRKQLASTVDWTNESEQGSSRAPGPSALVTQSTPDNSRVDEERLHHGGPIHYRRDSAPSPIAATSSAAPPPSSDPAPHPQVPSADQALNEEAQEELEPELDNSDICSEFGTFGDPYDRQFEPEMSVELDFPLEEDEPQDIRAYRSAIMEARRIGIAGLRNEEDDLSDRHQSDSRCKRTNE